MPGFFDAVKGTIQPIQKVHTVNIQGQSLVVTLEKKLEVLKHGEDAYIWKSPTEIMLKPKSKTQRKFPVLKKSDRGYLFNAKDPFWVVDLGEEGHTWQIESE